MGTAKEQIMETVNETIKKIKQTSLKNKILVASIMLNAVLIPLFIFSVTRPKTNHNATQRINSLRSAVTRSEQLRQNLARELEVRKRIEGEREAALAERQRIIEARNELEQSTSSAIGDLQRTIFDARNRIESIRNRYSSDAKGTQTGSD